MTDKAAALAELIMDTSALPDDVQVAMVKAWCAGLAPDEVRRGIAIAKELLLADGAFDVAVNTGGADR